MKNVSCSFLVLLFGLMFSGVASAGGPLMGEPTELNIGETTVSFLRDYEDRYQFYYLPIKPRLAKRQDKKFGEIPVFTFVKYDFGAEGENIMLGGIIQLAVTVGLFPNEVEEAKKQLAKQENLPENRVRVGMVNVTEASIEVLGVKGQVTKGKEGGFTASILGHGPSIRHASAEAPFVLEVSQEGASIYEELMTGGAGLGFNYTYTYEAVTPKINVNINGNADAIYKHYSSSSQAKLDLSDLWISSKAEGQWQKVRDDLVQNTGLKIEWFPERPSDNASNKIVELIETSILNKILTGIFEITPPKTDEKPVGEAKAAETSGWNGGFSYSLSLKKKSVRRTKSKTIAFQYVGRNKLKIRMNKTGGFVSIKPKNKDHKAVMFKKAKIDDFFGYVEFTIVPPTEKPSTTGISSVNYYINCGDRDFQRSYVSDANGKGYLPIGYGEDGMLKVYCANPDRKYEITYHVELVQAQGRRTKTLVGKKIQPLKNNVGAAIIENNYHKLGFEEVEIDASEFIFRSQAVEQREEEQEALEDIEDEDELEKRREQLINPDDYPKYVKGKLKHGKDKYSFKLNAETSEEGPIIWYTAADDKPITLKLSAHKYKSKPRKRKHEDYYGDELKGEEEIVLDNDSFK